MKKSQDAKSRLDLLGGLTAEQFLQEYWQKKPLLIRNAIPDFSGLLSPEELAGLACEEGVQSRLVSQQRNKWRVEEGPFEEERFLKLPARNWTLLVQEVNHHLDEADALLRRFNFIPYARLDDLMVSYAPDEGGVGPHFDSYDVFLLQGQGKRLWRISEQKDLSLIADAPLRILKHFETEQEWLLGPGDMLYLPPHIAHWGIAKGDCMTYSIGFRAPSAHELVSEFLNYLQEKSSANGLYVDPDLTVQDHPAEIGGGMLRRVTDMLRELQWEDQDVARFLGRYLSAPKPHVMFDMPDAIDLHLFSAELEKHGIVLTRKSQLLFHDDLFFMNGEEVEVDLPVKEKLRQLADHRKMPPRSKADEVLVGMLYEWYLDGYVCFPNER